MSTFSEEGKRFAVLTTGRQDYGILRSTLLALQGHRRVEACLWAGGMHLSRRFGRTIDRISADGITVQRTLPFLSDPPEALIDFSSALQLVGQALANDCPDALILVGDRTEALAAGIAATLGRVPIAHLHGGEETQGAIDNVCRHALTKLSHLHLVSHTVHAARVVQMGEDPDSVIVVGAPGLDNRFRKDLPTREELEADLGTRLQAPVIIVTVHPNTLSKEPLREVEAVSEAISKVEGTIVITQANSDPGGDKIAAYWKRWCAGRGSVVLVEALGETRYWALMREANVVVGNSSSGIIEAPVVGVPTINVGDRQQGRLRVGRVWDVPPERDTITAAIRDAIDVGGKPIGPAEGYPEGPAAPRIVQALDEWDLPKPPRKVFRDSPWLMG